jgi:hypothetical protein
VAYEAWLRHGLSRRLVTTDEDELLRSFAGIVLGLGDYIIELVAATPGPERVPLGVGVAEAISSEAGAGARPGILVPLLALARRLRPPGLAGVLRSLWARRVLPGTPVGKLLDGEVFQTAASLSASGSDAADTVLNGFWIDDSWRQPDFVSLWLRAKVRSGRILWTRALEIVAGDMQRWYPERMAQRRFIDVLLADAGSLAQVRVDIDGAILPNRRPWFIDILFAAPGPGPLRVTEEAGQFFLDRLMLPGSRRQKRVDRVGLPALRRNSGGAEDVRLRTLWNDLYALQERRVPSEHSLHDPETLREAGTLADIEARLAVFDRAA